MSNVDYIPIHALPPLLYQEHTLFSPEHKQRLNTVSILYHNSRIKQLNKVHLWSSLYYYIVDKNE